MDPTVVIGSLLTASVTALGAYVLAARRMSGKIGTSDASQLWEESRNIRNDYRQRLDEANARTTRLEERVAGLEATNTALERENIAHKNKIDSCERLATVQKDTIERLEATVRKLEKTVRSQRKELEEE